MVSRKSMELLDIEPRLFTVKKISTEPLAGEYLAEGSKIIDMEKEYRSGSCVLEITINMPQNKKYMSLSLMQKIDIYKTLFRELVNNKVVPCTNCENTFTIEYCASKEPHLHGHLRYTGLPVVFSPEGLVMDIVKYIYKQLPRGAWSQIHKNPYNHNLSRFKAPAVCINYKRILEEGWVDYTSKSDKPKPVN